MPAALLPLLGLGIATGALGLGAKHLQQKMQPKAPPKVQHIPGFMPFMQGPQGMPMPLNLPQVPLRGKDRYAPGPGGNIIDYMNPGAGPVGFAGLSPEQIESQALAKATGTRQAATQGPLTPQEMIAQQRLKIEQANAQAPKDEGVRQGADGYLYYTRGPRTGQRVLPGVEKPSGALEGRELTAMSGFRKEYLGTTQAFRDVSDAIGRVRVSAKQDSAAGDLSMIFAYMKVLDPASVVRESEFATAQNAAAVPERIRAKYNQMVTTGERLTPKMRQDFLSTANNIYKDQEKRYEKKRSEYTRIAKGLGMDPSLVVPDFRVEDPKSPAAPRSAADAASMTDAQLVELLKSKGYDARLQ